jgi:circadian clock protein KaiB
VKAPAKPRKAIAETPAREITETPFKPRKAIVKAPPKAITKPPGRYSIEVVDMKETPQLAQGDQILAVPTVVRKLPAPMRKIIGNMSDLDRVLVGLDLSARDPNQIDGKNRS